MHGRKLYEMENKMPNKLHDAVAKLKAAPKVNIKGKDYATVATRVEVFRDIFTDEYSLETDILPAENPLVRVKATIRDKEGRVVATGLAEESRQNGAVNRTSAIENCETSAIGRALANFGLHGGEYASANEMEGAAERDKGMAKTALKAKSHELVSDIHACEDLDSLIALQTSTEFKHSVNSMKTHYPEGYEAVVNAGKQHKSALETNGQTALDAA